MDSQNSPRELAPHPSANHRNAPRGAGNSCRSGTSSSSLFPGTTDATLESPRTLPLSFRNLSVHEADTATSAGMSTSPSRLAGCPMLMIRKSSVHSSTHSHSAIYSTSPLRHRRQSVEFTLSPPNPKSFALNSSSHEPHNEQEPHSPTSARSFETTDVIFPGGMEPHGSNNEDGGHICPRHHHRQSVSSTISITCSSRSESVSGGDDEDEVEVEAIALEPMAPSMLVPLVDRNEEMADLLGHPANAAWVKLARRTIGPDVYDSQCVPLWTATSRREMPDLKWLKKSKSLLETKGCGGICDGRLWSEFCGMVGWEMGSPLLDEDEADEDGRLRSRSSHESIGSTSSSKMISIAEEEEPLGV